MASHIRLLQGNAAEGATATGQVPETPGTPQAPATELSAAEPGVEKLLIGFLQALLAEQRLSNEDDPDGAAGSA